MLAGRCHSRVFCVDLTASMHAGLSTEDMTAMQLGLAHSLSRYKLKFSPDKVDTMIVQAICTSPQRCDARRLVEQLHPPAFLGTHRLTFLLTAHPALSIPSAVGRP